MNSNFDITIIGSGLLSAKIALIAAKQGLKVCLLSENDFGDVGTFNKIDIVDDNDVTYEKSANNFIPIDLINIDLKGSTVTKYYKQFLSKITNEKFKNGDNLSEIEPQLKNTKIEYATVTKACKYDYARVCIDTVITAKNSGAEVLNYVIVDAISDNTVSFTLQNIEKTITSKLIFDLRKRTVENQNSFFTIPRYKLELTNSMLISSKDFKVQLIPYFSVVFVKSDSNVDKQQAIQLINNTFAKQILEKEILDSWNEQNDNSELSVNGNFINLSEQYSQNKLTVIDEVFSLISKKLNIEISGNLEFELHNNFTFEKLKTVIYEQVDKTFREVQQTNISPNEFTKLYYRYGSKFEIVIEKTYDYYTDINNRKDAWLMAQIWYAKNYEMAKTVDDFIYRRANIYFSDYFNFELKETIEKYFSII